MTTPPLPAGFGVVLDPGARRLGEAAWFGGSPPRVVRLTPAGVAAWRRLQDGPVASRRDGALARRLTDAGIAQPCPPPVAGVPDVTVVVPVHGRADLLDQCLSAAGGRYPVIVVDDASPDPAAVAAVAARHRATLVCRGVNGGPAAARDTGLRAVTTDLVAYLDSDCVPGPDWIDRLAPHLADPLVAAVAPRIVALADGSWAGRYTTASCALDMGSRAARVAPHTTVGYVPAAALLLRRAALDHLAGPTGAAFDHALRTGEDVDLVWRLHTAGWRVRYEPAVQVGHREPPTWSRLLQRRYRYGTSAAPLAARHPGALAPLVLHPLPAAVVLALLAGRPVTAAAAVTAAGVRLAGMLRKAHVPVDQAPRLVLRACYQTWVGTGRYAAQFAAAPLLVAATLPGRHRRQRFTAAAAVLLGPPLVAAARHLGRIDPVRFVLGRLADDAAYGAGVVTGCVRNRTIVPLLPMIHGRTGDPLRAPDGQHVGRQSE